MNKWCPPWRYRARECILLSLPLSLSRGVVAHSRVAQIANQDALACDGCSIACSSRSESAVAPRKPSKPSPTRMPWNPCATCTWNFVRLYPRDTLARNPQNTPDLTQNKGHASLTRSRRPDAPLVSRLSRVTTFISTGPCCPICPQPSRYDFLHSKCMSSRFHFCQRTPFQGRGGLQPVGGVGWSECGGRRGCPPPKIRSNAKKGVQDRKVSGQDRKVGKMGNAGPGTKIW